MGLLFFSLSLIFSYFTITILFISSVKAQHKHTEIKQIKFNEGKVQKVEMFYLFQFMFYCQLNYIYKTDFIIEKQITRMSIKPPSLLCNLNNHSFS